MSDLILDFTALLAPISHKEPTGKNLREDNTLAILYHQLKDARIALRTLERQQTQENETIALPDWSQVYSMAIDILCTHSKDLEVTAWLIEALLRKHKFSGLCAGFSLARQLCEKFWGQLYPLPDEDGVISLVAPFSGLNGETVEGSLITPLALTPLTPIDEKNSIALWQYREALELFKIATPEKRTERMTSGFITPSKIASILNAIPGEKLNAQRKIFQDCIAEFQKLNTFFQEKCGEYAPPSSRILAQLEACLDCLNCVNSGIPELINEDCPVIDNTPTLNSNFHKSTSPREQILHNLLQAAEFFRSTEPHSPISYMLERTVHWAKMPLPILLNELISDDAARVQLHHLTGIKFE